MPDPTFSELREIIASEFNVPADTITPRTTAEDIDGWDSVSHAALIALVEKAFRVTIPDDEIYVLADVGALAVRIEELQAALTDTDKQPDRSNRVS